EALLAVSEWGSALAAFNEALRLQPDYAKAHFNRGVALSMVAEFAAAKEAFVEARRLDEPLYRQCLENVRRASGLDRLLSDAVPQLIYLSGMYVRQEVCDWRNRTAYTENFLRWLENGEPFMDDQALAFQGLSLLREPPRQLELCRRIAAKMAWDAGPPLPSSMPFPGKKIRVGYVSPDFRFHPTARLSRQLFHLQDRERFEVYAYSLLPDDGSALHRDIRHACDCFVDVTDLGFRELAQRIREDGIDILVDMAGHTRKNRFEVFTLRAVPLQVAYLAFPSTTGADFIDYLMTDAVTCPAGSERFYSERLVYLPRSYLMYDNEQRVGSASSRSEMGLPENGTVFCCFNNPYKIEPEIFSVWMRILERVPGSVLWLLAGKEGVEGNLRREAAIRGIAPDRLVFAPFISDSSRHLARYRLADLFLDTTICNAHTTAADALWAGLPVLTCAGETHWSRVAASLLESVGLPELIATNLMEYENRAVTLASRPRDVAELKSKLEQHKRTWPLFDTAALVKSLEDAYQRIWDRHLAGLPPQSFSLPAAAGQED
ncbi:MAG: tetratricopeptide repeat protein, partial [Sulfuricellaceae bacterium]